MCACARYRSVSTIEQITIDALDQKTNATPLKTDDTRIILEEEKN